MQNMLIHDHTSKRAADTSFIINKLPTFFNAGFEIRKTVNETQNSSKLQNAN